MNTLLYYHIQYGGMPMTQNGLKRFIYQALLGGYTYKEIEHYIQKLKEVEHEHI